MLVGVVALSGMIEKKRKNRNLMEVTLSVFWVMANFFTKSRREKANAPVSKKKKQAPIKLGPVLDEKCYGETALFDSNRLLALWPVTNVSDGCSSKLTESGEVSAGVFWKFIP